MHSAFGVLGCLAVLVAGAQPVSAQAVEGPPGAAWDALRAGNHEGAERTFQGELRARPADPLLHLGLGIALLGQQRSDEARAPLTRALQLEPRLTAASALLGQILYAAGDLEGAIAVYERATLHAPGVAGMRQRLDRWRSEARLHAGYEQGGDGRFSLLFEGPEERTLAARVHRVLEAAYWRIGARLNTYPGETIPVILYTQEQFRDVTGSPTWAVGAYDGRIRLAVRDGLQAPEALDRVVLHEFVHALIGHVAPRGVPAWLHEGLAVNLSEEDPRWADAILAASPQSIPLAALERGFSHLDSTAARLAYAEGAVAAGVVIRRLGPNLPAFLQALGTTGTVDAGLTSFGFTTADLDATIRARMRSR
jgi:tetratricopeptide (TPR) repeat protein